MRLAIRHVSKDRSDYDGKLAAFHNKLAGVHAELQRSPFGAPSRVHAACSEVSDWLTVEIVEPVAARPFDDRAVADAINVLIVIGSNEAHDYDSARQIAWSLQILACDLSGNEPLADAIAQALNDLAPSLRLELANGSQQCCSPVTSIDELREPTPLAADLPAALAGPVEFDPEQFRQQMQKLRTVRR